MSIIPSSPPRLLSFSPLLPSLRLVTVCRGPGLLPLAAMARSPQRGVVDLLPTFCCIPSLLRDDRPVIQPVARHARPCFYTQASHITAEGLMCSPRGVGERSAGRVWWAAGVDTNAYFCSQTAAPDIPLSTSPSSTQESRHGGMDEPC